MIREEIIKYLSEPYPLLGEEEFNLYDKLKDCIFIKFYYENSTHILSCKEIDSFSTCRIDDWFKGVIESLYYRPNHFALIFKGENQGDFFRYLLPEPIPRLIAGSTNIKYLSVYEPILIEYEFEKNTLDIVMEDNFTTITDYSLFPFGVGTTKRLSSYCSIVKDWHHPPRKSFIVLDVVDINLELFNSIDKYLLWIEIFNKFKPKDK